MSALSAVCTVMYVVIFMLSGIILSVTFECHISVYSKCKRLNCATPMNYVGCRWGDGRDAWDVCRE
jgi:hypothetical protein